MFLPSSRNRLAIAKVENPYFPSLLHSPLKTLLKQCKAETTGDKSSAGKKICLTYPTESGNLLCVVVLNRSSRHEQIVSLSLVHLSGFLLWNLVINHFPHHCCPANPPPKSKNSQTSSKRAFIPPNLNLIPSPPLLFFIFLFFQNSLSTVRNLGKFCSFC